MDDELKNTFQKNKQEEDISFDEILVRLGLEEKLQPLEKAFKNDEFEEVIQASSKLTFVMKLLPILKNEGH